VEGTGGGAGVIRPLHFLWQMSQKIRMGIRMIAQLAGSVSISRRGRKKPRRKMIPIMKMITRPVFCNRYSKISMMEENTKSI